MTPYALTLIPEEDVRLFDQITSVVRAMEDLDLGLNDRGSKVLLSCHMLARAIGEVFHLEFVDGFYVIRYQHSWIMTRNGNIIDVYPVGMIGGPLLVETTYSFNSPGRTLYDPDTERLAAHVDDRFNTDWFQRSTMLVTTEVRNALERLGSPVLA